MKQLMNKNAIITGGSRGLGYYIAKSLAKEKVNIALVALPAEREELNSAANELQEFGVKTIPIPADITKEEDRNSIIEKTIDCFGGIDILINNAGIQYFTCFEKDDKIIKKIETNITGPLLLTKKILPVMKKNGGNIVTISSTTGKTGTAYDVVYSATKAALIKWTLALNAEYENTNIHFSVVIPGYVSQAGILHDYRVLNSKSYKTQLEVTPEKVARAVMKSIKKNKYEVYVTPGIIPMRLVSALVELCPELGNTLLKLTGVIALNKQIAEDLEQRKT